MLQGKFICCFFPYSWSCNGINAFLSVSGTGDENFPGKITVYDRLTLFLTDRLAIKEVNKIRDQWLLVFGLVPTSLAD